MIVRLKLNGKTSKILWLPLLSFPFYNCTVWNFKHLMTNVAPVAWICLTLFDNNKLNHNTASSFLFSKTVDLSSWISFMLFYYGNTISSHNKIKHKQWAKNWMKKKVKKNQWFRYEILDGHRQYFIQSKINILYQIK